MDLASDIYWWIFTFIAIPTIVVTAILMVAIPVYRVWALHKSGQADLARARNEQQNGS
jgi:hypothetical protein